jgi:hypothetical protein
MGACVESGTTVSSNRLVVRVGSSFQVKGKDSGLEEGAVMRGGEASFGS